MAQLGALISFQAGTPAVANDVNYNFNLIRTFINSANFGVDNIDSTLSSRSGAPILALEQVSEPFSPLYIINAQSKHAINIWQQASLDANQGVILINDTITQSDSTTAALLMTLAAGSTNPAILIKHGSSTETLRLTKDALSLFTNNAAGSASLFASAIELSQERVKLPLRNTTQRDSVTQEGSVLYDSTKKELAFRTNSGWIPASTPTGSVQMFVGSTAPQGWLLCDGSEYLKTSYPDLDAALSNSNTYPFGQTNGSGGAGTTHFRVPDMRGIFVRGVGSQTISGQAFTGVLGQKNRDSINQHSHGITEPNSGQGHRHLSSVVSLPHGDVDNGGSINRLASDGNFSPTPYATTGITINNTGTGIGTETAPGNIALNYIIKY